MVYDINSDKIYNEYNYQINMPLSILISIYAKEQPAFFKESLDSILNQSCSPDEGL